MESEAYLGSPLSNHMAITFEVLTSLMEQHLPQDSPLPTVTGLSITARRVDGELTIWIQTRSSPTDSDPTNNTQIWNSIIQPPESILDF